MTRQAVEMRLAELRASLTQQMANAHATEGAIQDCEYWLAVLAEQEKPEEPKA